MHSCFSVFYVENHRHLVTILISAGQIGIAEDDLSADTPIGIATSDHVASSHSTSPTQATPQTGEN